MKCKMFGLTLGLLAALVVVVVAAAHGGRPPEPVCPEGQITVTAAVWVPEEWVCPEGYEEHDGHCRQWHDTSHMDYTCPDWYHIHNGGQPNQVCHRDFNWMHPEHMSVIQTWHTQGHWNTINMTYIPGYWITPVCREPVTGCTDPLALNYNQAAEVDDGSCEYAPPVVLTEVTANDCEGWQVTETTTLYDGSHTHRYASDTWEDPYTLESVMAFGLYVYEPAECLIIQGCMDEAALNYNPEADESDGTCIYARPVVNAFADCAGWSYTATDANAESITLIGGSDAGAWLVGWETETNAGHEAVYRFVYDGGDPVEVTGPTILESESCYSCPLTPLYHMFVLRDYDAPTGYLQGGTCYVISDTIPSVERQAAICTYPFCGGDWTYRADSIPYGGYVYRDCHGNIVYGWSAWGDSWLRHDFTMAGRDPNSPRLPCCGE